MTAPPDTLGAVLGDLAARRGPVTASAACTVTATVPVAQLFGYASRLRSRTHGRGTFTSRPAGYQPAAQHHLGGPGALGPGPPRHLPVDGAISQVRCRR